MVASRSRQLSYRNLATRAMKTNDYGPICSTGQNWTCVDKIEGHILL